MKVSKGKTSETGTRVDAVFEWRSPLTAVTGALILHATVTGLVVVAI